MSKINVKLYFKKRKQRLSIFGISPTFDWRIIIGIAGAVLVSGIVYAIILYVQITNGSLFETIEDQSPKIELEQKRMEIQQKVEQIKTSSFDEPAVN